MNIENKKQKRKVEITENGYQKLSEFMEKVNLGEAGKVRSPEVLEYAVQKLKESDIDLIQETYYSPAEKIDLLLKKTNAGREGEPLTKDQLLASMLSTYQKAEPMKTVKAAGIKK